MATHHPAAASTTATAPRAAVACQSCRRRKCDAQSAPSDQGCGPCRQAGQECLLDPLSDGRRSVNRKFVDRLQQRIEMLEDLNKRPNGRSAWSQDEDGNGLDENAAVLPSALGAPNLTDIAPPRRSNSADAGLPKTSSHVHPAAPLTHGGSSPGNACDELPSFYGATCHPHVVSPGDESRLVALDEADAVGVDLDPSSPRLRDHLMQSFFKYQSLWVDVVDRVSFLDHQVNGGSESRWHSRFLENAMLACGTRLSTSKSVRALGVRYCGWAKDEVLKAMSEPTPANLQGFLLLSEYEVTQGNSRPGWMFCGVACRMLSDLGLHELAGATGDAADTPISAREGGLAYALLSACVTYEGVWTLYLGRPSSIPRSAMSVAASRCKQRRKSDSPWLNAWVALCVPMAEIAHVLNKRDINDADRSSALRALFRQLEEWYADLPPELTYDEGRLTNMDLAGYGLHAQYCKLQILLRRTLARMNPQGARKRRHSQLSGDAAVRAPLNDSSVIIYQYAQRIARLVVTYREAFGMEKMPSIMLDNAVVAATAMIDHLNSSTGNVAQVQRETVWLRQLVKSMESVQPHFPIVGRMLDSLAQISRGGPLATMFPSARGDSTQAARAQGLPAGDPFPLTGSSAGGARENPLPVGGDPGMIWECFDNFDTGIPPSIFSSGGFGDFIAEIPDLETMLSHPAQPVS